MFVDEYYGQHNSHRDWIKIISGRSMKNFGIASKNYRFAWSGDKKPPKDDNYEPYY